MSGVNTYSYEEARAIPALPHRCLEEVQVGCSHALVLCQVLQGVDATVGEALFHRFHRLAGACNAHQSDPTDTHAPSTGALWREFITAKLQLREQFRSTVRYGQDWQSPLLAESDVTNTESDPEYCLTHGADYKRYLHKAGATYEKNFLDAGGASVRNNFRSLLCSSGMAAIQTSLLSLFRLRPGPVVADSGLYHETKFLLNLFAVEVTYVDCADLAATEAALHLVQPSVVLLEPMRNSASLASLPSATIARIMETVATLPSRPFLWFDDSVSLSFPTLIELGLQCQIQDRIVVAMSLLKLFQHGMDIASAGMVLAPEALLEGPLGMGTLRTHTGANVSDLVAAALPKPDLTAARERLAIITRNVGLLSRIVEQVCGSLFQVVAPGTSAAVPLPPSGFFPYLNLIPRDGSIERCRTVVAEAIRGARESKILLHAGTSFGFDVTRLYVIDSRVSGHIPFFRISPGLESASMITALGELLSKVCLRSVV